MLRTATLMGLVFFLWCSAQFTSVRAQETTMTFAPAGGGVRVIYKFARPVMLLPLGDGTPLSPAANVHLESAGVSFAQGQLSSTRPISQVIMQLTPDSREIDSVYPLMLPVGRHGFVVFTPYLLPSSGPLHVRIAIGRGVVRSVQSRAMLDGYIVVGAEPTNRGAYNALVSDASPTDLRDNVLGRTQAILNFYSLRLHQSLKQKPTLVLSFGGLPAGSTSAFNRGDVTPNGVVFMRVYAGPGQVGDPSIRIRYTAFLSHELFHLWNRNAGVEPREWWMHEGGAEYASWIATAALWPSEISLEKHISDSLRACAKALGPDAMNEMIGDASRNARYPCGAVMQWIADVGVRSEAGPQDFFDVWRRIMSDRTQGPYTTSEYVRQVKVLAPDAVPLMAVLLEGEGEARWSHIIAALDAMGAKVDISPPPPFFLRATAAQALVLSACGAVQGVGEDIRGLYVQAPGSCATFGDAPVIERAAGLAPMADADAFYKAVRDRCAVLADIQVMLRSKGGARTQTVRCKVAVSLPPPDFKVERALPLATR